VIGVAASYRLDETPEVRASDHALLARLDDA
jgi:hypothetical protein